MAPPPIQRAAAARAIKWRSIITILLPLVSRRKRAGKLRSSSRILFPIPAESMPLAPGKARMSFLTHLDCTHCGRRFDADALHGACPDDGRPLYPRYDLEAIARAVRR